MPLYYFDLHDTQGFHRDDIGVEFPNMDAAVREARRTIAEMSREVLARGSGADHSIKVLIRDHGEGPVLLSLSLTTEHPPATERHPDPHPAPRPR